jgi:hypothetical protein
MSAVVQRQFDLGLATGRPMHSVNSAMAILDQDEDAVLNLIELGFLAFAFDIRSPKSSKREPRILTESIRSYLRGDHLRAVVDKSDAALDQALKQLFKHSRPTVRGTEIRRAFNCSSQHILDLVAEDCLKRDEKVKLKTVKSSPAIYRSSVISFLKSRRLP